MSIRCAGSSMVVTVIRQLIPHGCSWRLWRCFCCFHPRYQPRSAEEEETYSLSVTLSSASAPSRAIRSALAAASPARARSRPVKPSGCTLWRTSTPSMHSAAGAGLRGHRHLVSGSHGRRQGRIGQLRAGAAADGQFQLLPWQSIQIRRYPVLRHIIRSRLPGPTCAWDFGDGARLRRRVPSHPSLPGRRDYPVQLSITTVDGQTNWTLQTLQVRTHDVAVARFMCRGPPAQARHRNSRRHR